MSGSETWEGERARAAADQRKVWAVDVKGESDGELVGWQAQLCQCLDLVALAGQAVRNVLVPLTQGCGHRHDLCPTHPACRAFRWTALSVVRHLPSNPRPKAGPPASG